MLPILLLVVLASAQYCPYCQWNACQMTAQGLGNCSACNVGALIEVQTLVSGYQQTIGICQQCPAGCLSCSYGMISPADSGSLMTINCTSCASLYTYNYQNGSCMACAPNCLSCYACGIGQIYTVCSVCASGYTPHGPPNFGCVPTSVALEENQGATESSSSTSSVTIGLSVWGSVMTVAAIAFLILWLTKKDKKAEAGLLDSEIEVQRVAA